MGVTGNVRFVQFSVTLVVTRNLARSARTKLRLLSLRCCVFVVLGRFAVVPVRIETLLQTLDVDPLLTLVQLTLSDFEALLRGQDTLPRVLDDRLLRFDFPGQSFDLPRVVAIVEVPSIQL